MCPTSSIDDPQRAGLITAYEDLPSVDQSILQMLSVLYEPVTATVLLEALREAEILAPSGEPFTHKTLKPVLEALIAQDLVCKDGSRLSCHRLIVEVATRRAVREGRLEQMVLGLRHAVPRSKVGSRLLCERPGEALREIRVGLYQRDFDYADKWLDFCLRTFSAAHSGRHPLVEIAGNPVDPTWMRALPSDLFRDLLYLILHDSLHEFEPAGAALPLLQEFCGSKKAKYAPQFRNLLAEQLIFRGRASEAAPIAESCDEAWALSLRGWLDVLKGDDARAIEHYAKGLAEIRKQTRKRKVFYSGLGGTFFILALLRTGDPDRIQEAADYLTIVETTKGYRYAHLYAI